MSSPETTVRDPVERIEAAARRAQREAAGQGDAEQRAAISDAIDALLAAVEPAERDAVAARLRTRNPQWQSSGVAARSSDTAGEERGAAQGRAARLERELRELRAQFDEQQAALAGRTTELDEAQRDLESRADEHRQLQRRAAQDREELLEARETLERSLGEARQLQEQLRRTQELHRKEADRAIRLDAALRELRGQQEAAKPAAPPAEVPPEAAEPASVESAADGALEKPAAAEPPAAPAAAEPVAAPVSAWSAFCEELVTRGLLESAEAQPATPEQERRLGAMAAALVAFEVSIEQAVLSQVEELKRRHSALQEHYDVLQYYRKSERVWWWSLTERAGRHVVPERQFAAYLSHLGKMNYALLTGYFRTLAHEVSKQLRERIDPAALRRRAASPRKDALWDYFETQLTGMLPREVSDACAAQFAKVVDQLYRYGTASG